MLKSLYGSMIMTPSSFNLHIFSRSLYFFLFLLWYVFLNKFIPASADYSETMHIFFLLSPPLKCFLQENRFSNPAWIIFSSLFHNCCELFFKYFVLLNKISWFNFILRLFLRTWWILSSIVFASLLWFVFLQIFFAEKSIKFSRVLNFFILIFHLNNLDIILLHQQIP